MYEIIDIIISINPTPTKILGFRGIVNFVLLGLVLVFLGYAVYKLFVVFILSQHAINIEYKCTFRRID